VAGQQGSSVKGPLYVEYWKEVQARQQQQRRGGPAQAAAPSTDRERPQHYRIHTDESQEGHHVGEPSQTRGPRRREDIGGPSSGPWESWKQQDWQTDWWHQDDERWSWRNPRGEPERADDRRPAEEEHYDDDYSWYEEKEEARDDRRESHSDDSSYDQDTSEPSPIRKASGPPASKRSRSTQVSDEFVQRQQAGKPVSAPPPAEDLCANQLDRLHKVVELLEKLANAGLPTLLHAFYRSGDFTKLHDDFHQGAATQDFPRVGNWNLSLVCSLPSPQLRGVYDNAEKCGTFVEAFTVYSSKQTPKATCMAWQLSAPGGADHGYDGPVHTGYTKPPPSRNREKPEQKTFADYTVAGLAETATAKEEAKVPETPPPALPLQLLDQKMEVVTLGDPSWSVTQEVEESGTEHWVRKNGQPRLGIRIREDGYMDMGDLLRAPRFWDQWITEAEVVGVIHYNQKNRFEVDFRDGRYQVRALQGHSIRHIKDDLILTRLSTEDTPVYAAHGTYYDFYESILRHA
ncbi:trpt1, partial [Symbiodinium sp. CCMP2456]